MANQAKRNLAIIITLTGLVTAWLTTQRQPDTVKPANQPPKTPTAQADESKFDALRRQAGLAPATALPAGQTPRPAVRVQGLGTSLSVSNVTTATTNQIAPQITAVLRTARARIETRQMLRSEQREGLDQLERRLGVPVELRLRGAAGTPRFLELPEPASGFSSAAMTPPERETVALAFLSTNRALLRLSEPASELELVRHEVDDQGRAHLRFAQTYRGLKVWPAEFYVHLDGSGNVRLLDGAYVPTPGNTAATPTITADIAVELARQAVEAGTDAVAGAAELFVYGPGDTDSRLAWKVEVTKAMDAIWIVVVDAVSGQTLNTYSRVMSGSVAGSGTDLFGVTRPLTVWQQSGVNYLADASKPMFASGSNPLTDLKGTILVLDWKHAPPPTNANPYYITSAATTSGWLRDGVSAAFNSSKTYDYFKERQGRNSLDGQGLPIIALVRYQANYNNAFYSKGYIVFGDAMPYAGALDVIAHELTHGVTEYSANLVYLSQPGALNEAMSDIFAESVEAFVRSTNDWLLGSDLASPIRSMANPALYNQPSRMSQFRVMPETQAGDNGGVHINSGIINHAFYLLAGGPSNAIGINNSASIFYRALTYHLVSASQFLDCRLACIQSAKELFGANSVQVQATAAAFDAVEIYDSSPPPTPPPSPVVNAADSVLFPHYDTYSGKHYLSRRETALGDPAGGKKVGTSPTLPIRPSVVGDGSYAVFVTAGGDMAYFPTDGTGSEDVSSLGFRIAAATMSPDISSFAVGILNTSGQRENSVYLVHDSQPGIKIELKAPTTAGESVNTILYADTMCFTPDNRYLVYDALNGIRLSNGTTNSLWSIYAYDTQTGIIQTIVPPVPGLDIGNPAMGHVGNGLITFEVRNIQTHVSTVYAANLEADGDAVVIGTVNRKLAYPCFNGDDSAIVYAQEDTLTDTGTSLMRQPLQADHITPTGSATKWVSDATSPFVYRRGTYTSPPSAGHSDLVVTCAASASSIALGGAVTVTVTVVNQGPDAATTVVLSDTLPVNATVVSSALSQGTKTQSNGKITGNLGSLARGASAILTLSLQGATVGSSLNSASASCDQVEANPADNNAAVLVTVTSCSYTLSATSAYHESGVTYGSFVVTSSSGCGWQATTSASWLHTYTSGSGSGTVYYSVDATTATNARSGIITVGGRDFTVTQGPGGQAPGYTYTTSGGRITITKYTGSGGAVAIPATINGLPVTSIGSQAFRNCANLRSVTIPSSVTSIGQEAFRESGLTSVTIPNSVTSIETVAFYGCYSLTNVTIPNSVTSIGNEAFNNCHSLTAITVDALNSFYSSVDGVLFNKSQSTLITYPGRKAGGYNVPNCVSSIEYGAFCANDSLTSVTIPNSVTSIRPAAFASCYFLTNVTIGNGVTSILYSTFYNCSSLTSVTVGDSVGSIEYAFDGCTRLTGFYFNGNAPTITGNVPIGAGTATVYYLAGTTGWGATFGGRPTAPWVVCTYGLSATTRSVSSSQGAGTLSVTTSGGCSWSAVSNQSWLHTTSSGSGDGTVSYTVDANTNAAFRTGTLTVGGQTFTVTQGPAGFAWHNVFGWVFGAGSGWYHHNGFGWMWISPNQWIWSLGLQGWVATMNSTSRTLWSQQFRWLTPSESDPYRADTTAIGAIYLGQYNGTAITEGWVVSGRFGYVWAAGDGKWFYSNTYGWLGVTDAGGIWCVNQNKFL